MVSKLSKMLQKMFFGCLYIHVGMVLLSAVRMLGTCRGHFAVCASVGFTVASCAAVLVFALGRVSNLSLTLYQGWCLSLLHTFHAAVCGCIATCARIAVCVCITVVVCTCACASPLASALSRVQGQGRKFLMKDAHMCALRLRPVFYS